MQQDNKLDQIKRGYSRRNVFIQIFVYIKEYKNWFLLPLIITLLIGAFFIFIASTGAGPFIYTLF